MEKHSKCGIIMKQTFEIEWDLGQISRELIILVLVEHFRTLKHPIGNLHVEEIKSNKNKGK